MKAIILKKDSMIYYIIALLLFFLLSPEIKGETCTKQEAEQVCNNWLAYNTYIYGDWAGEKNPYLIGCHEIIESDTLLGYHFTIYPSGYINIPVLKELHPISSYSETYEKQITKQSPFQR